LDRVDGHNGKALVDKYAILKLVDAQFGLANTQRHRLEGSVFVEIGGSLESRQTVRLALFANVFGLIAPDDGQVRFRCTGKIPLEYPSDL
jgi:hypothetical protein